MEGKREMKIDGIEIKEFSYDAYNAEIIEQYVKSTNIEKSVMFLPKAYRTDLCFAQESIDLAKYMREKDKSLNSSFYGDIENTPIIEFRSVDIWLPVIFVGEMILLPLVVNLCASYIYDKMKGREDQRANVDISFVIKEGKKSMELHYKGDASSFKDAFEKIDPNKLFK
jgi:hypothetical protein